MAPFEIRVFPDPVLRQPAAPVTEVDAGVVRLAEGMIATMQEAPGIGLAAPQVGVLRRVFVYDLGDGSGAHAVINPVVSEAQGEWVFEEGCLSIPGLSWDVVRPKEVHLTGVGLDGEEISIEADEILARVVQHELDHLDGILFIDRLDPDERRQALADLRNIELSGPRSPGPGSSGAAGVGPSALRLPGLA